MMYILKSQIQKTLNLIIKKYNYLKFYEQGVLIDPLYDLIRNIVQRDVVSYHYGIKMCILFKQSYG